MRNYCISILCNTRNTKHLFTMFLLLSATFLFSQRTVTGVITDEDGLGLPGVSIIETGTTNGTITDLDGNYSVSVPPGATLTYSFVGYAAQIIEVGNQSVISFALQPDAAILDEVVVTGYAVQTRGDLTGAVASVDVDEANKAPLVNVAEALDGRVSGVSIINNGNPGAAPTVRIRGLGTVNNNNPLYIIDGVQTTDGSILNSINPNDVEQINVLKDGSASIYGARASNGVIIVTTKSGSYNQDKATFSVNGYVGYSRATRLPNLLGAQELGNVLLESTLNDGLEFNHPQFGSGTTATVPTQINGPSVAAPVAPGGTDWLNEIFRSAPTQNIDFTVSNGSKNSKFSLTGGLLNRQGTQLNTQFVRGLVRLNSEHKVSSRLKIGQHLNVSLSNSRGGNVVQTALRVNPLIPVRDSEGNFEGSFAASAGLANATNPVADLERASDDFFRQTRVVGDVFLQVNIIEGLNFKTSFGGDINSFNDRRFLALNPEHSEPRAVNALTEQNQNFLNWTWTNTLNYVRGFGKHTINVLGGTEAVRNTGKGSELTRTGFLIESPEFYTLANGSGDPNVNFAFDNESTLSSIFGSANYQYDDKYFATVTVRSDQSSNFSPENTQDLFPSVSLGWVLSNENFFKQGGIVDYLKLKGSWGRLGNQSVPTANPAISISSLDNQFANFPFNGNVSTGAILSSVGNPNLTWETSETTNFGFEIGLFDSKLFFSAEYFNIETEDLIAQDLSVINDLAIDANAPFVNIGAIENNGFDFSLSYDNDTDSGFSYGVDATLSTFNNEVTELVSAFQTGNIIPFTGTSANRTQVGQPIASFFGRVVDGIYRNEAEVAAGPDQGFADAAEGVGRFRYVDINNDGVINDDDRTFIGSPHADFSYGVNLRAAYKGFDISAFISGVSGNDIYNGDRVFTDFPTFFNSNRSERVLDSFSSTNQDGTAPALSTSVSNEEIAANSFFIEDGSFLRLKNVQIGYTLPQSLLENVGISQLRFYITGSNLATITDYTGLDPEIQPGNGNNALTLGLDVNNNPLSQIFLFGVNIKL